MRKPMLIIVIAAVVVLLAAGSLALVISASSDTSSPATSNLIGEDEAYRIALAHANVTERRSCSTARSVGTSGTWNSGSARSNTTARSTP